MFCKKNMKFQIFFFTVPPFFSGVGFIAFKNIFYHPFYPFYNPLYIAFIKYRFPVFTPLFSFLAYQ